MIDRRTYLGIAGTSVTTLGAGCVGDNGGEYGVDDGTDSEDDVNRVDAVSGADGNDAAEDGDESFEVETIVDGLNHPWGIEFLPDDSRMLVTEREGTLSLVDRTNGTVETVAETPPVHVQGQGGLLDVALDPDWTEEPWVYLTYAAANDDGESALHIGRGWLDGDEPTLDGFEELHVAEPFVSANGHYGSRIAFGEDGAMYVTSGDRQFGDFGPDHVAQDTTNELGATLRLAPDGSIPDDNPFVDEEEVVDSIYSYGHRNQQGLTVHPETGDLWASEHGEEDGDEINVIEAGGNYGWPIAHYGCAYGTTDPIGDDPAEREDVIDPVYYWECTSGGFPPAGMTFYSGAAFSNWQGNLFLGNLAGEYLGRFVVDDSAVEEANPLLTNRGWRIRDVAEAPDTGYLYVIVDDTNGPLVRLTPTAD